MKKRIVDPMYLDAHFPPEPARYAQFESNMLGMLGTLEKEDAAPPQRKRLPVLLLAAILVIVLGCTALAVVRHFSILDAIDHFDPTQGTDVSGYVIDGIAQEGSDLGKVSFVAHEAVYDGRSVHFIITAQPASDTTLPVYVLSMEDSEMYSDALRKSGIDPASSDILGVYCEASLLVNGEVIQDEMIDLTYVPYASGNIGNTYFCVYDAVLPAGISPDNLTVACTIGYADNYADYDAGTHTKGEMSFVLPKTGAATVREIDLNLSFEGATFDHITLTHTPIEMSIVMTGQGEPDTSYGPIMLINVDGTPRRYTRSDCFADDDGQLIFTGSFATDTAMPETVTLWPTGANHALVLSTESGHAAIQPVDVLPDGRVMPQNDE